MELKERVVYVRKNLATARKGSREPWLSLDDFATAVGAKNRQAPMRWERGGTPRDYAERIAELTPYPPAAFGAPGESALLRQTFDRRLREAEEEGATTRQAVHALVLVARELVGAVQDVGGTVPDSAIEELRRAVLRMQPGGQPL